VLGYEVLVATGVVVPGDLTSALDPPFILLAVFTSATLAIVAVRSDGPSRRAWLVLSLVAVTSTLGDIVYVTIDALGLDPVLSIADVFYLATYPLLLVAFWWIARSRNGSGGVQAMFDGLLLAAGISLLAWELLVVLPGNMPVGELSLDAVLLLAYPTADLLLLGAAAGLVLSEPRIDRTIGWLLLYLIATIGSDVAYLVGSAQESGTLTAFSNVGFAMALVFLGLAALSSHARSVAEPRGRAVEVGRVRMLLLGASLVAPATTAAVLLWLGQSVAVPVLLFSTGVLAVVVSWRVAEAIRAERAARMASEDARHALWEQSRRDELTGLGNRLCLLEDLSGEDRALALLFMDLDRFKQVNDTSGHAAGDEVLQEVTRRLLAHSEDGERTYRLSGDEFVMIRVLDEADRADDEARRRATTLAGVLSEPYFPAGMEWHLTASVGCAIATEDGPHDANELLRQADVAMYRVKREPGDAVRVFDSRMQASLDQRHELELALRRAVDREEFEPALQPIVDLNDGRVVGFESLARWRRDGGFVAAGEFISVAEQLGLLPAINRQVSGRAFRFIRDWNRRHRPARRAYLATNVSASEIVAQGMVDELLESLRLAGTGPESIVVELTEGALVSAPEQAAGRLTHLRRLGVRVALDDFGTGYSSLSHLLRFPVDIVKIDRSFVAELTPEQGPNSVAAATYQLAETLGLDVVAEGVEEPAQSAILSGLGVRHAQGYLFSRPLPVAEALELGEYVDPVPALQLDEPS
jgi:diguanylate cyclase (GGDEF)-like protein